MTEIIPDTRGWQELRTQLEVSLPRFEQSVRTQLVPRVERDALQSLQTYPPPIPTSRYRRTYRLRRGWKILAVIRPDSGEITADNPTPYARYVQDIVYQVDIHRGRWGTAQDTSRSLASGVEAQLIKLWNQATT